MQEMETCTLPADIDPDDALRIGPARHGSDSGAVELNHTTHIELHTLEALNT